VDLSANTVLENDFTLILDGGEEIIDKNVTP
jgi:hypothetical protein